MASENVDLVRRIYESFLSRDTEAARSFVHPDIEWDMRELGVPGLNNLYSGLEGVDEFYRQWLDAWDELDLDVADPIELRDGRVVVVTRGQRNLGRGTGMWVEMPPYEMIWTLRDGRAVAMRLRNFE